jgi:hypothetical protein
LTKPTALITLGCSWTYGVGVGWKPGMNKTAYNAVAWDPEICAEQSWRGILTRRLNASAVNLSLGGSSNQRQFRLARTYFSKPEFRTLIDSHDVMVLWGITSTARNEMFDLETRHLHNFPYDNKSDLSKAMTLHCYEHQHEVFMLSQEMLHWNDFFESKGVKNYWFDTFNHHEYQLPTPGIHYHQSNYEAVAGKDWPSWTEFLLSQYPNDQIRTEILDISRWDFASQVITKVADRILLKDNRPRDLMSRMCLAHGMANPDTNYHISLWEIDSNRVEFLINLGLLNPITYHPTSAGHQWIADFLMAHLPRLDNC